MMNNPRVFLWIALAAILVLNYQAWTHDYGAIDATSTTPAASSGKNAAPPGGSLDQAVPQTVSTDTTKAASATHPVTAAAAAPDVPAADSATRSEGGSPVVHVRTDVLDLDISLQGGTIEKADLLRYPKVKGGSEPVRLMNEDSEESFFVLKSGLTGPGETPRPTQLATYSAANNQYDLGGARELVVPLSWTDGQGVTVTKTFTFRRGDYRIGLAYKVDNRSASAWEAAVYAQILRFDPPSSRSMFNVESYAFHGPAIYDGTKYRKLKIDDADDRRLALEVKNGWLAALQHHFVSAIVPQPDTSNRFTLSAQGRRYQLATVGPLRSVAPDETATFQETLFIGPKLQSDLESAGPRLELVADYGVLTILARPLFWLLGQVHSFVGNWGVTIVIVTFLLKLLFYPLSEASGRSMAKMKTLAPRIKNLQDTYKDDKEKLGRAMMELYKREKINPVAGCLPIIIQIPVFLAFYWVLLESVEMRQAPFLGWIHDLSARDPLFILPLIMAGAMFVQYKLNPTPPDPVQAKVFMIMPLVMSFTFAFFPAGLVLYWVTNTLLSIAQQWNINRRINAAAAKKST
jgi:YidC/Oxa1 family membrane protein insertase